MGTSTQQVLESGKDFDINRIRVKASYQDFIESPTAEEFKQLEENLLKEGCRDALILTTDWFLVDGHNRFKICQKHGLNFRVRLQEFSSDEEVHNFMIDQQLGRRNLNDQQIRYLQGMKYNMSKSHHGGYFKKKEGDVAIRLSKELGSSPATLRRNEKFYLGMDVIDQHNPQLKKKILKKEIKASARDIERLPKLKNQTSIKKKIEQGDLSSVIRQIQVERKKESEQKPSALDRRRKELANLEKSTEEQRIKEAQKVLEQHEPVFLDPRQRIDKIRGQIASDLRRATTTDLPVNEKVANLEAAIEKIQQIIRLVQLPASSAS